MTVRFRYRYIAAVFCAGSFFSVFRLAICFMPPRRYLCSVFRRYLLYGNPTTSFDPRRSLFLRKLNKEYSCSYYYFFFSACDGCQRENAQGRLCLVPLHGVVCMHWKRGLGFVVCSRPRSRCFLYIQQKVKERLFAPREMSKAIRFYCVLARVPLWKFTLCEWVQLKLSASCAHF